MGHLTQEEILAKKSLIKAKATTYLMGENKNNFFDDVAKIGTTESRHLNTIIKYYYENHPRPSHY